MKRSMAELTSELVDMERQRDNLFAQRAPIDRKIEHVTKRIAHFNELIGEIMVEEGRKNGPDWKTLVRQEDDGRKYYEYVQSQFEGIGLGCEGYWADTYDRNLRIKMTRGSQESFDITKRAIELIAPLLTEMDGMVRFSIFEHSLSANGIYMLWVTKDLRRAKVTLNRWDKFEGTLDEVLTRIQRDHYYDEVGD
ncbi:hypothetical protein BDS110ZK17_23700 [Bradyrhizobium diazoefficiens]|nr:hypothetical protein XF16B_45470 [Bradyrhizobium diazoefficiens]BCF70200.1 hypothetical protein XF19B_45530 [Bradyrhizobium diazoefficiens]